MSIQRSLSFTALLLAAPALLPLSGCVDPAAIPTAEAEQAILGTGYNNIPPSALDTRPLKPSITGPLHVTAANGDPNPLCQPGTLTTGGCALSADWDTWRNADSSNR